MAGLLVVDCCISGHIVAPDKKYPEKCFLAHQSSECS